MRKITERNLKEYRQYMYEEEKSKLTIEKYMRDLRKLAEYVGDQTITKELLISYKEYLLYERQYKVTSVNSFLVAANRFFEYKEWQTTSCHDDSDNMCHRNPRQRIVSLDSSGYL